MNARRPRACRRWLLLGCLLLALAGCDRPTQQGEPTLPNADAIQLNNRGVDLMGR
jgi:hypothetical protein